MHRVRINFIKRRKKDKLFQDFYASREKQVDHSSPIFLIKRN